MAIGLLDGTAATAATPQAVAAPPTAAVTQAVDIPSAGVAARLSGKRVEALSERTETSTTWANKDGSLTSELSAGPVRFKDGATGDWRNVDLNLARAADGSVEPRAHPAGLKLAGRTGAAPARSLKAAQASAATDLVTLGEGENRIALQWKGGLPAPALTGTRAEYVNAIPGADVVVEATRSGFEQFVEIKQRPATAGYTYTLPLKVTGLKVGQRADGSVLFTDRKNKTEAVMPAPIMWDATVDPVSGEHTRRVPVALKVVRKKGSVDLVLTPDATFLADPKTRYPVTVDPSTSALSNVFDTYVQQGETVDWSADTELDIGNPGTTNPGGTPRTARSFITWNTTPVRDALITDAKLSLWNFHSANTTCTDQPWEVWATGAASTASRWTAQPTWTAKRATSTETRGNPGCAAAPDGWINADVTTMVQEWASARFTTGDMGLRATSETAVAQWKRVNSANAAANPPKLTVTYNYRPKTGTQQEAGTPYFSYGGDYVVDSLRPTLRDTFADVNGDKVNGTFQIFDDATNTQVGALLVSPYVPSGQVASVTVPAGVLTHGKTYRFRTSPYDGSHYNLGWSAWKKFTVDTAAPSSPLGITSTDYPSNAWVKGAGQPGTFTVTPPAADHHWLEWSLDGTAWTKVVTGGSGTPKDIVLAPPKDGTHTLRVRAVDRADHRSEAISHVFHAGPGGFLEPAEGDRTARRLRLVAEADSAAYDHVSFSWRRSEADPWVAIPVGHVTAGGTTLTAWPVPLVNGRNAPLVWNATDTVDPDGTVQIRAAFNGPASATGSTQPLSVVIDRDGSSGAVQPVGPGTVNLLTGDLEFAEDDASYFGMNVSRTSSSRTPDAQTEGQAPIFGKEWTSGTVAEASGTAHTQIVKVSDTALSLQHTDGSATSFTANAAQNGWVPEPGAEESTLTGTFTGGFTLTDTTGVETVFTKPAAAATTWVVDRVKLNGLALGTTDVVSETIVVGGKTLARPERIVSPSSAAGAATCASTPATRGCRSLEFVYANATTATSVTLGDVTGQVREVRLWSTEPGAATATSKAVQVYRYDSAGRLRQLWNPQITPALKTEYEYDAAGRVTSLTTPGQLPWTFTYGTGGGSGAAGGGMLLKASRSGLRPGTTDVAEGTHTTSLVYDVPLTGAGAPYQMGAADVLAWGQSDHPTDATAVFPGDVTPASHSGSALTAADYRRAGVHYLNASGLEVDSAAPGGHITTTEHDRFGNRIRELTPQNRATALGTTAAATEILRELGIQSLPSQERARQLSTISVYSENGAREESRLGPLHRLELTEDLKDGTTVLVTSGTSVPGREVKTVQYDQGRPTDGSAVVRDQVTAVTTGVQVRGHEAAVGEKTVKQTQYDWTKGMATRSVQDAGGLDLTTTTSYDAQGRISSVRLPGSAGGDAATRTLTYWSATGTGPCEGRPEWADALCSTAPAGAITGGGSQPAQLPTAVHEYGFYGQSTSQTETANGATRTTTMTHDAAGRPVRTAVSGPGEAVPEATT
ncbi:DNRLRE domain-containing protein, partial [Streptomyces sp. NPDC055078]